jgi:HPt (histidine-containing phosphotransfer) domain-containing protein
MADPSGVHPATRQWVVWDPAVLRGLFGDDAGTIAAVVATFLSSMQVNLADVDQALHEGRSADLGAIAHRIKGAARMMGAMAFAEAAEVLERSVPGAAPEELTIAAQALRHQWDALEQIHRA